MYFVVSVFTVYNVVTSDVACLHGGLPGGAASLLVGLLVLLLVFLVVFLVLVVFLGVFLVLLVFLGVLLVLLLVFLRVFLVLLLVFLVLLLGSICCCWVLFAAAEYFPRAADGLLSFAAAKCTITQCNNVQDFEEILEQNLA